MTSSEANLPTLAKMLFAARKKASRDGPIGVRVVWRMPIICIDHKLCTWSSNVMAAALTTVQLCGTCHSYNSAFLIVNSSRQLYRIIRNNIAEEKYEEKTK